MTFAFSRDAAQKYLFVGDGINQEVWILSRADLHLVGRIGAVRGEKTAADFGRTHNLAVDSKGNLYTAEVDNYKRVQRFTLKP